MKIFYPKIKSKKNRKPFRIYDNPIISVYGATPDEKWWANRKARESQMKKLGIKSKSAKRKFCKKYIEVQKGYVFLRGLTRIPNDRFKNYPDYCRSLYFIRLKAQVLRNANNKCSKCGHKAQTAHHEIYRSWWTNSLPQDCQAVCHKCHQLIHKLAV
jgi:hypothetical protein